VSVCWPVIAETGKSGRNSADADLPRRTVMPLASMPWDASFVGGPLSEFGPLGSMSARTRLAKCQTRGGDPLAAPPLVRTGVGSGGLGSSQFTVHRSPHLGRRGGAQGPSTVGRVSPMPQPGDPYANAFIAEHMKCWRMIHDRQGQATY
jgi:hypothetical protein